MSAPVSNSKLTFGLFEVDLESGELWKAGFRIKLQSQPFKVLAALLERPGQIVTRDDLQLRLWGRDTVVDFDHSLGTAINKVREALGDSADNPRYIETLAKRGYRFIAPVGIRSEPPPPAFIPASESTLDLADPPQSEIVTRASTPRIATTPALRPARRIPSSFLAAAAILFLSAIIASYLIGSDRASTPPPHIAQLTHSGHIAPGVDTMENLAAAVTDGVHLFAGTIDNGRDGIAAVSLADGSITSLNVPDEVAGPALGDISPDGSRLLLRDHLSPESEQPLWAVPTVGGSALRIGNVLAHDATWMPNKGGILYANGNNLYLSTINTSTPSLYASLPGRAFWLRWSPDGKLLRFTIIDPLTHTTSLWQLSPSDRKPSQILPGFSQPSSECCGVWTADGGSFIFQSDRGGNSDLWRLSGNSITDPVRLTNGPLEFRSPVAARTGNRIFFLGVDARSDLQRLVASGNASSGQLVPERGFLSSAVRVDYTRDGKWVAWTDSTGQLWRARADGEEKIQLAPDNLDVFLAHWSPDGKQLALMAREPGKAWQIYLVGAEGDNLHPLLKESRNAADPSWAPDGKSLVFGRVNDYMGKENAARTLHILHLDTHQVDEVPGSDNLFSPRWSPDGRWIAALTLDQRQVRLFDVASHTWTTLPVPSGADPVWSSDSRFLYIHASLDPAQPIDKVSIPDGHVTELIRLADSRENDAVDFVFGGLTQQNEPLIRARIFTGNFFSMDLH